LLIYAARQSMTSGSNSILHSIPDHSSTYTKAKEVFNDDPKTIIYKDPNTEIQTHLNQLKAAIDNNTPFMDVMKIVCEQNQISTWKSRLSIS
jgi:hypothetical protein